MRSTPDSAVDLKKIFFGVEELGGGAVHKQRSGSITERHKNVTETCTSVTFEKCLQ